MDTQMIVTGHSAINKNACDDLYNTYFCEVQLVNKELWDQFHNLQTEMIITKNGRRMFPALNIQISDLDPSADYCVFLDMVLANHCRFKYSASAGWSPAGQEEAQSQHNLFVHPESPAKGSHWMSQTISFSRVKLTNTCTPPPGQIVLSSMHKYQPRILITKTLHPEAVHWAPTRIKTFPETQFVAVTAYQNERITKLKINYNPFAKGFRENGKSHTKRKQNSYDQEMVSSKRVSTTSPPPQPILKNSKNSSDGVEQKYPILPSYNYVYPPYSAYSPYWLTPPFHHYSYPYPLRQQVYDLSIQEIRPKPKKITDFSINAILRS